jgi:hypothetical protein
MAERRKSSLGMKARGSAGLLVAYALAAFALLACACQPDRASCPSMLHPRAQGPSDKVVATVDGLPILGSRVALACGKLGLPAEKALEGMIEMTLLAAEAERRGLAANPDVERMWKKALVQALLESEVESRVDPGSVTQQDIRAYYAANYKDRGVLLEDAWRDIWAVIVIERRHAEYLKLAERARSHARVVVDEQNVLRYLGGSGPTAGSGQTIGGDAQAVLHGG